MIPNLAQGIGGLVLALLLYPVLSAVPDFACMADRTSRRRWWMKGSTESVQSIRVGLRMNSSRNRAEEIVFTELVYA